MTEEQKPQSGDQQDAATGAGQQTTSVDLVHELRELGSTIERAIRTAVQSDRAKSIQDDLANGFREVGHQVTAAFKSVQENERVKELAERGQQAFREASSSKLVHDIQETLKSGLEQLNTRLRDLVDRLETERSLPTSQNVPVEDQSSPATGPTTRLDGDDTNKS